MRTCPKTLMWQGFERIFLEKTNSIAYNLCNVVTHETPKNQRAILYTHRNSVYTSRKGKCDFRRYNVTSVRKPLIYKALRA